MNGSPLSSVLERQLLLQLGERLRAMRKAQRVGTVDLAARVGISRTTLAAVEAGDPGTSIGVYVRVMSALGVVGDVALLAGDALQAAPAGTAGARSTRARPAVAVTVSAQASRHELQDLQSLALHEEAVRIARANPAFLTKAQRTLDRWLSSGGSRSSPLWHEWSDVLRHRAWRKVLAKTRRAQELRQASPLTAVMPQAARRKVLQGISEIKAGVALGAPAETV